MSDRAKAITVIAVLVYLLVWNGAIIAGTAYAVFWLGYSGWWWLLALVLMAGGSNKA